MSSLTKVIYKFYYHATMGQESDSISSHCADAFTSAYKCRYEALGKGLKDMPMCGQGGYPWKTAGVFIMMHGEAPCFEDSHEVTGIMYAGSKLAIVHPMVCVGHSKIHNHSTFKCSYSHLQHSRCVV